MYTHLGNLYSGGVEKLSSQTSINLQHLNYEVCVCLHLHLSHKPVMHNANDHFWLKSLLNMRKCFTFSNRNCFRSPAGWRSIPVVCLCPIWLSQLSVGSLHLIHTLQHKPTTFSLKTFTINNWRLSKVLQHFTAAIFKKKINKKIIIYLVFTLCFVIRMRPWFWEMYSLH